MPPLGWSIATGAVVATIWILEGDTVVNKNWGNTNGDPIPDDGTMTPPVD
jgi:hypothetical protein